MSRSNSTARSGAVHREPVPNEPPQAPSCHRWVRSELAEDSLDVEKAGRQTSAKNRSQAAPLPVLRIANEACPHGVERDVAMDSERVGLVADEHRVETSLEDMTTLLAVPVCPLGIPPVDVLHPRRQVWLRRGDQKVKVGREQAVRPAGPTALGHCELDDREELCALVIVTKDEPTVVRVGGDVEEAAGDLETRRTWHGDDGTDTGAPRTARRGSWHEAGAESRGVRPQGAPSRTHRP